jgi:putative membrane protein
MRIISYIFLLAIIIFGMTFATLNSAPVVIHYYVGEATLALSLLLALAFSLGCVIGMIAGLWLLIKSKLKVGRIQKRLTLAEREIENLRAIPLQDKV